MDNPAIIAYGVQLALNRLWSPLFFGLGWRGLALADILLLDIAWQSPSLRSGGFSVLQPS